MNRNAGISWTHDTASFWRGCDKVSAACLHCYIDRSLRRLGEESWGTLYRAGKEVWRKPEVWQQQLSQIFWIGNDQWHCNACGTTTDDPRHIAKCGAKPEVYMRMFTCSLSDFFHVNADKWRDEAWHIIRKTPNCIYLILTKRPERILTHLPKDWSTGYKNVWLGVSIGDVKSVYLADVLRKVPASVRFLSCEPLIEDISDSLDITGFQWVIAGGESGDNPEYLWDSSMDWRKMNGTKGRRTMKLEWAYKLYMKSSDAGVPFFFKQVTAFQSGQGADKLLGRAIHEFPPPPNRGVWWEPSDAKLTPLTPKVPDKKPKVKKKKKTGFTVWKSPHAAAIDSIADDLLHYRLTLEQKKEMFGKLCDYPHAKMIRRGAIKQVTRFNPLTITYFPHFWNVPAGGLRTPQELFNDYPELAKALNKFNTKLLKRTQQEREEEKDMPAWIAWYLTKAGMTPANIRKAVKMCTGVQGVSAFSPAQAAAINHYLKGGVVWDMSAGWGGRLIGSLICDRVKKYVGSDPCTQTFEGLLQMRDELLPMARATGNDPEIKLYKLGSETPEMRAKLPKGGVDLCWTSPPYFSTEKYSDESTQSWKRFREPDSWLNGFLGGTLDNCEYCLKPNGVLAINIADVKPYKKLTRRELTDDFKALAESKGWLLTETLQLELSAGPGAKHKHGKHKHEPLFVFKKPK